MQRNSLAGRALMAAALVAAGNAGSPMVKRETAPDAPRCQRCGHVMVKTRRQGDDTPFWVCGNSLCGVAAPTTPVIESRQVRRARERQEAKHGKR